jgi:hypothetical protein
MVLAPGWDYQGRGFFSQAAVKLKILLKLGGVKNDGGLG